MKNLLNQIIILALFLLVGCAKPNNSGQESLVTPIITTALIIPSLALLPLYVVFEIILADYSQSSNEQSQLFSLDDVYRSVFNVPINDSRVDQHTGQIAGKVHRISNMRDVTTFLRELLKSKGIPNIDKYVVCAVEKQDKILLSVVERQIKIAPLNVISKHTNIKMTLNPYETGWNEPYKYDVTRHRVDLVVDWVAIESSILNQDKAIAVLILLAAQSIHSGNHRAQEYWRVERLWLDGHVNEVMRISSERVEMDTQ